jgi:hypothetical protein
MNDPKEIELGQVFEQSRQNAKQIETLHEEFSLLRRDLSAAINALGDRLSTATAPNFSTLAAWATVVIMIIGMVAAPVAFHFNSGIQHLDQKLQKEYTLISDAQRQSIIELDTRLQREFLTANQAVRDTASVLKEHWSERHQDLMLRTSRLEDWQRDTIRGDLDELRQRRLKDKP